MSSLHKGNIYTHIYMLRNEMWPHWLQPHLFSCLFFSFLKVLDTLCDVHLVKLSHICINVYYRQGEFVTGSVLSSGELNFGALC